MADLAALRARFQSVQAEALADASAAKAHRHVNQRSVVEIVTSLQRRRCLDLVYATDGSGVVTTRAKLKVLLLELLASRGGRLPVCEAPALLCVDAAAADAAVAACLRDATSDRAEPATCNGLQLLEGELLQRSYVERVLLGTAAADLRHAGCVEVAHLARRLHLPSAFVHTELAAAVAAGTLGVAGAKLDEHGAAYVDAFVQREQRKLACALLAASRPVLVGDIAVRQGCYAPLLSLIVDRLSSGPSSADAAATDVVIPALPGQFSGSGSSATYTPQCFERARANAVHRLLASNGFVPFSAVAAQGISNPRGFLAGRYACASPRASTGARAHGHGKRGAKHTAAADADATLAPNRDGGASATAVQPEFFFLEDCLVSDSVLRDAADSLLPSFLAGCAEAEVTEGRAAVPPAVDLAVALPDALLPLSADDANVVVSRAVALHPRAGDPSVAFIVGGTTFVRASLWRQTLEPQVVTLARGLLEEHRAQAAVATRRTGAMPAPTTPTGLFTRPEARRKLAVVLSRVLRWGGTDARLDELLSMWADRIDAVATAVVRGGTTTRCAAPATQAAAGAAVAGSGVESQRPIDVRGVDDAKSAARFRPEQEAQAQRLWQTLHLATSGVQWAQRLMGSALDAASSDAFAIDDDTLRRLAEHVMTHVCEPLTHRAILDRLAAEQKYPLLKSVASALHTGGVDAGMGALPEAQRGGDDALRRLIAPLKAAQAVLARTGAPRATALSALTSFVSSFSKLAAENVVCFPLRAPHRKLEREAVKSLQDAGVSRCAAAFPGTFCATQPSSEDSFEDVGYTSSPSGGSPTDPGPRVPLSRSASLGLALRTAVLYQHSTLLLVPESAAGLPVLTRVAAAIAAGDNVPERAREQLRLAVAASGDAATLRALRGFADALDV